MAPDPSEGTKTMVSTDSVPSEGGKTTVLTENDPSEGSKTTVLTDSDPSGGTKTTVLKVQQSFKSSHLCRATLPCSFRQTWRRVSK